MNDQDIIDTVHNNEDLEYVLIINSDRKAFVPEFYATLEQAEDAMELAVADLKSATSVDLFVRVRRERGQA